MGLEPRPTKVRAVPNPEKTVNGVRTVYRVDPFNAVDNVSQVLVEETGGEAVRYLYGLDLLGEVRAGTPTYYGYDALSIRLGLGEGGALTARYRYAPFGEVEGEGPAGYGFTGERWDGEVGLLYLRARYYRPAVGRFVSRDPLQGELARPATLHSFLYVVNNPVNHVDVTGLCPDLGLEPTACEKFAREVEKIIRLTREVMQSQTFLGVPRWSEQEIDWVTVQFLAEYYAGIRAVDFAGGIVNPLPRIYAVPVPNADRYPKGNLSDEEYGFKRDFYNNTHHYIGLLYYGYSLGEEITKDVLSPYLELWNAFTENRLPVFQCPPVDCARVPTWQLWLWVIFPPQECRWVVVGPPEAQAAWFAPGGTLSDLRVAEIAAHHGALIREQGISLLPGLIRREVCEHLYYGAPGRR